MSKKSSPGDGSHSKGTKGGSLYGGHVAVPDSGTASQSRLARSLSGLAHIVRTRRA
jgi:hypothetical protein